MTELTTTRQGDTATATYAPLHVQEPTHPGPDDTECERFIRSIYDEYGSVLIRFAARLLGGDWIRAEDIFQEAVVRAWRHIALLGPQDEGLRPWLFTVVRNLVIDDHRARLIRPVTACSLDSVVIPMADDVERTLTQQIVNDALRDLTPQQRQVLHHMYFLRQSVAEASKELDIAQGTVKSRTYYAMRALKTALQNRGVHG
ncbi:sigma-70 family RNA polymerase sigma factor [Streptomyces sp. NPDC006654]|uniref:sigma-70 family RNA polymerase sigma factor n=1 Tax=Streptomyces sp. NPDC006654 TaxID=3156897 RepID=UPI0033FA7D4A